MFVAGVERTEVPGFGFLRQAKTAPCGDEHGSRRTRTDHGGSKQREWVYTGPMPGAKMEILAKTFRQADEDPIPAAFLLIVFRDLLPQSRHLVADGGVSARVVHGRFGQDVDADGVLLELVGLACQGLFGEVAQETAQAFRWAEGAAVEQPVQLGANLGLANVHCFLDVKPVFPRCATAASPRVAQTPGCAT